MPLTFVVSVACVAFYLANAACGLAKSPRAAFVPLFVGYVAIAAGILLKGPIGAVLPAVVTLGNRLVNRGAPHTATRTARSLWWGVPLVLALTLPWFLRANALTNGEFFRVFIWYHNVERGIGGSTLRSHAWWLYLPYFANDFLPWTPLLLGAGYIFWRRGWWRVDREACFGLVWLTAVVGILSCARFKRADYLLPAYPAAAVFGVRCDWRLAECWKNAPRRQLSLRATLAVLFVAVVAGWTWRVERGLPAEESFRDYRRFAAAVREVAPSPEPVIFFHTEAHALAFHVGRPLTIAVQWEELQARLAGGAALFVVMPPGSADQWPSCLHGVRLREVLRNTDFNGGRHERPLVLLRAEPESIACPTFQSYLRSPTNR